MGISDRDYVRQARPRWGGGGGFGGGRPGPGVPWGIGGMSGWSFNTWIIVISVAVFLIDTVVAGRGGNYRLESYGYFSTSTALGQGQIWRFITFQFLHSHAGFLHVLLNMLALFWFGPMVEQYLGSRRYLAFYLLCGCAGAGCYLVLNLLGIRFGDIPFLLPGDPRSPLIGASAGVFGVILAAAAIRPDEIITLLLFFILPLRMRIRTLAYGVLILAVINVFAGGSNAGGDAAHIGGALLGAWLIRHATLLNWVLLLPLDRLKRRGHHAYGQFGKAPTAPAGRRSKSPKRSAGGFFGSAKPKGTGGFASRKEDKEVDRILSKVAMEGLHSLTDKEKKTLSKATERQRGQP